MTTPSLTNPNPKREGETPAAMWRVNGEPDPFGSTYDGLGRHELAGGQYTDDELAHMCGMADGRTMQDTAVFTMAKERIRWLSRQLEAASARPSPGDPVRAALEALEEIDVNDEADRYELRSDADYAPNDFEKTLLEDFGAGLLGKIEASLRAALSVSTPTGEGEAMRGAINEMADAAFAVSSTAPSEAQMSRLHSAAEKLLDLRDAALAHPQQGGERVFKDGYEKGVLNYIGSVSYAANMELSKQRAWDEYSAPTSPSKSSGEEA